MYSVEQELKTINNKLDKLINVIEKMVSGEHGSTVTPEMYKAITGEDVSEKSSVVTKQDMSDINELNRLNYEVLFEDWLEVQSDDIKKAIKEVAEIERSMELARDYACNVAGCKERYATSAETIYYILRTFYGYGTCIAKATAYSIPKSARLVAAKMFPIDATKFKEYIDTISLH